ncbi:NADH:ubiquinone oxidoreductase subunit D [Clostridium beijerinckii]|uniref:hypothetical protein n=1 Tax=Clostridium beijerinckii TaxID=1520 RepID=UPI001494C51B|nr:hypothetical protein [Clostridium beijerinckii]NOW85542.1 NADH:ubiquinone oxidoreductase subunit D [Clostridium beijerinckii]
MSNLVCVFNPFELIVDANKALALARWGCKCKNIRTREKILKSCYKLIKNSKIDKSQMAITFKNQINIEKV